jgi:hypothetical protein
MNSKLSAEERIARYQDLLREYRSRVVGMLILCLFIYLALCMVYGAFVSTTSLAHWLFR